MLNQVNALHPEPTTAMLLFVCILLSPFCFPIKLRRADFFSFARAVRLFDCCIITEEYRSVKTEFLFYFTQKNHLFVLF